MTAHRLTKAQLTALRSADRDDMLYIRADVGRRLIKAGLIIQLPFGYQLTEAGKTARNIPQGTQ